MRKSIQDRINEMKNVYYTEEEETTQGNPNYTFNELKQSLLNDKTSDFIEDFSPIDKNDNSSLLVLYVDELSSEQLELPIGTYVGLNKGSMDIDELEFDSSIPRGVLESSKEVELLFRVGNSQENMSQQELVRALNNNVTLEKPKMIEGHLLSQVKTNYLEIVDSKYFDSRIDEILVKYKDIESPNKHLERNLRLREKSKNKTMVFCPLLDKEIYTFGND